MAKLTKAQEKVLKDIQAATTLDELAAAVADLKTCERNDKRVGYPVHLATERLVK